MTLSIREASGLTDIGQVFVREASGLTAISEIWVREASGLVQVFSTFGGGGGSSGLSASPESVSGFTTSHSFQRVNTDVVTITVSPAGSVDSVSWSFVDAGWDAIYPLSLTTAFRSPAVAPADIATTTATCTVTRGADVATIDVPASVTNYG